MDTGENLSLCLTVCLSRLYDRKSFHLTSSTPTLTSSQDVARGFIFPFRVKESALKGLFIHTDDTTDAHTTGLGLAMLVQYSSSPAGPYDELLYALPCRRPTMGFQLMATRRIPAIFVSTQASVVNGRLNWGVPKNLARFQWRVDPGYLYSTTTVTVSSNDDTAITTTTILPPVRIFTLNIPIFVHIGLLRWACPLFMQRHLDVDGRELSGGGAGELWHAYKLGGCGWARLCIATGGDDSASGSGLCPSLASLGAWAGIELRGSLVMPAPDTFRAAQRSAVD